MPAVRTPSTGLRLPAGRMQLAQAGEPFPRHRANKTLQCDRASPRQRHPRGIGRFHTKEIKVTLDSTANQSHARNDGQSALTAALAIAIIAAATLAGAWFFQPLLDIRPCPLCLQQRYAYYLAIPLRALVALAAPTPAP